MREDFAKGLETAIEGASDPVEEEEGDSEVARLRKQNEKQAYRIQILLKSIAELEAAKS